MWLLLHVVGGGVLRRVVGGCLLYSKLNGAEGAEGAKEQRAQMRFERLRGCRGAEGAEAQRVQRRTQLRVLVLGCWCWCSWHAAGARKSK